MGDVNQYAFVRQAAAELRGPFLEVGSRNYGSTQDLRSLFAAGGEYVGVDMLGGPGVDVVLDLAGDFAEIDAALNGRRFGTIFCLSVLEHCEAPFQMAENLTRLLAEGGRLCVSVPFAWKFHGYPCDYWRFTHEGVKKLFPRLSFEESAGVAASSRENDFQPLDGEIGKVSLSPGWHRRRGRLLCSLSAAILRLLGRAGLFRWILGYRYLLAPTMISLIGCKVPQGVRRFRFDDAEFARPTEDRRIITGTVPADDPVFRALRELT